MVSETEELALLPERTALLREQTAEKTRPNSMKSRSGVLTASTIPR